MGLPSLRRRSVPQPATDGSGNLIEPAGTDPADLAQPAAAGQQARPRVPRLLHRARGAKARPPETRVQWDHGDRIATRLLHAALVLALLSGPTAVVWVAVGRDQTSETTAASGEPSTSKDAGATLAEAAAQRLVLTWLTASARDKASLQALVDSSLPATLTLPDQRSAAPAQMWVGEVDEREPGRFEVTVATSGGPLGVAYFVVPVQVDGGAAVALALPARTRAPVASADRVELPTLETLSTEEPAFQTAAGYVTAYLTGNAELDRWTGPNARLTALVPRACTGVRVDSVQSVAVDDDQADPARAAVIATVMCQNRGRPPSTSQYGLILQVRDGRWEVAAEDRALLLNPSPTDPPISTDQPAPSDPASSDAAPAPTPR